MNKVVSGRTAAAAVCRSLLSDAESRPVSGQLKHSVQMSAVGPGNWAGCFIM